MLRAWVVSGVLLAVASAQETRPATVTLRGRVVDALHEPVPDVAVLALGESDAREFARTRTDGSGEFVLGGLPEGARLRVRSQGPGRSVAEEQVFTAAPAGPITLRSWDAARCAGHVLDHAGAPVAGARVVATHVRSSHREAVTGITDASGAFVLDGVPLGDVRFCAWTPGLVPALRTVRVAGDEASLEIPLERDPGVHLSVSLVGLAAADRERVLVRVSDPTDPHFVAANELTEALPRELVEGRPGERNTWHARGLPVRDYMVQLFSEDYAPTPDDVRITAGKPRQVAFGVRRRKPVEVVGWLRGPDGKPLAGERLLWDYLGLGRDRMVSSTTGGDGGFRLTLPEGATALLTLPRGSPWLLEPAKDARDAADGLYVHTVAANHDIELRAVRAATIRGRIVAAAKGVPTHALVRLQRAAPGGWNEVTRATTEADGAFALAGVAGGDATLRLLVTGAGHALGEPFSAAVGADVDLGELRLTADAMVEGVVQNAAGPVAGADVTLEPAGAGFPFHGMVVTDRRGRYRFVHVPAGEYRIRAGMQLQDLSDADHVTAAPGQTVRRDVTLAAK